MHTILFDIDGTLIQTKGAGFVAMRIALSELFGVVEIPDVPVHGRTDRGIVEDIFDHASLDYPQHYDSFSSLYWSYLPEALRKTPGTVLPGVVDLLAELNQTEGFSLGILTGNAQRAAEIKLQHFGLESFFDFGGYGDDHACRNEVARLAWDSAQEFLGDRFDPANVWVVGDTVNDIRCARAIDSRVAAVETGGSSRAELIAAQPDAQFSQLDRDAFMNLFK
jgi:phosphoglycolate phosphatase-like HAD superfamily hydrolase